MLTVFLLGIGTLGFSFALLQLAAGRRETVLLVVAVFGVFFIVPLWADLMLGDPDLTRYPGFAIAREHEPASLAYSAFVALAPIALLSIGLSGKGSDTLRHQKVERETSILLPRERRLYATLAAAPAVIGLLSPFRANYLSYASAVTDTLSKSEASFHSILATMATGGIIAGAILVSDRLRSGAMPFFSLALVAGNAWMIGKRAAVAIAFITLLIAMWQTRAVPHRKLLGVAGVGSVLLAVYIVFYQRSVRAGSEIANSYLAYRVDFARDSQLRFAFASQQLDHMQSILQFPGQSYLFTLFSFVPREIWVDKPYPYAVYFTNALFLRREVEPMGWGMTTSVFDEAFSNFGSIGLVLAVCLIGLACRKIDSIRAESVKIIASLGLCLLLVLQVQAFLAVLVLGIAALVLRRLSGFRKENYRAWT